MARPAKRRTSSRRKEPAARAANEVGRGFSAAVAQLNALGRPYALVGGFAVNVRTEPRFTADVDFAVSVANDAEAEEVAFELRQAGWVVRTLVEQEAGKRLATARFQLPGISAQLRVDLLFASTGVEPELVAAATPERVASGDVVPTATVGYLIALKCLSESTTRLKDRDDLANLVRVASSGDLKVARQALRLITQRGYARRKNLLKVLNRFLKAST